MMIDRRYLLMFVIKNGQKLHCYANRGATTSLKSKANALSG